MNKCEERDWDNGDMIDCGKYLPCELHPAEEIITKKTIDAIYSLVHSPFAYGEKYTDRVKKIFNLIAHNG